MDGYLNSSVVRLRVLVEGGGGCGYNACPESLFFFFFFLSFFLVTFCHLLPSTPASLEIDYLEEPYAVSQSDHIFMDLEMIRQNMFGTGHSASCCRVICQSPPLALFCSGLRTIRVAGYDRTGQTSPSRASRPRSQAPSLLACHGHGHGGERTATARRLVVDEYHAHTRPCPSPATSDSGLVTDVNCHATGCCLAG